jgi:hypothetical protein
VSEEGETPEPDWAEIIRQARYLQQQASETLQRLAEAARAAQTRLGPTLAAGQELARTMDAGVREVMEAMRGFDGQPPLPRGTALTSASMTATASMGALTSGGMTATARLGGQGTVTAYAGVAAVAALSGQGTVSLKPLALRGEGQVTLAGQPGELRRRLPYLSPGLLYAVLVVLLVVSDLSLLEMRLPPEAKEFMNDAVANAAFLAPFAVWWWRQNHKDGNDGDR